MLLKSSNPRATTYNFKRRMFMIEDVFTSSFSVITQMRSLMNTVVGTYYFDNSFDNVRIAILISK